VGLFSRLVVVLSTAATALSVAAFAHADEPTAGRLDGDLTLAGGLGATIGPRAPRTTIDLRARYMSTSGLFITYEDKAFFKDAEPERVLAMGLELRPLFLARWLTGKELDANRADLLIDSFGLELGGFLQQPQGRQFGSKPGFQAGLGLEIPIFANATGLFIGTHGGCRWADSALSGETVQGPTDRALFLGLTLSWHQVIGSHLVDAGDRAPE
jgi:hypothetical protein